MPDGSTRWVRVLAKAFVTLSGKPERMTGISLDITENKRAEEALVRSQHLLRETGRMGKVGGWNLISTHRNRHGRKRPTILPTGSHLRTDRRKRT